jgi:kynurenine formamidase
MINEDRGIRLGLGRISLWRFIMKIIIKGLIIMAICLSLQTGILNADTLENVIRGRQTVIDLTYPLNSKNAYWPGPSYFPFKYEPVATMERNRVFSGKYSTPEHLGTHIDAPNHFVAGKPSVDQIPLEKLVGPAVVIDVSSMVAKNDDYQLAEDEVLSWEKAHGKVPTGAIVLLNTGWAKRWTDYGEYKNADEKGRLHFPGFSEEAARFLTEERDINGIGIDTLSADYGSSTNFIVHRIINGAGKYILENVANLDKLPPSGAILIIAPIKIEGGSGGQARVWAILPHR